ncbi:MAG: hydroxymethylbilane synthase [Chlamydiota bacterium]
MSLSVKKIKVAARDSALSKAQVEEVLVELRQYHPHIEFSFHWIKTTGDLDQISSLLNKEKTDFFTKEVDEAILSGECQIAIHSAKDLPDPLHPNLTVLAYTKGLDPSDVLVFRKGESLDSLPSFSKVGTSSLRRIENLLSLREDLFPVDIRGTIDKRLALLDEGKVDALIMAKAALIRLKIDRDMQILPGASAPMQGRLAIVAKKENLEMEKTFKVFFEVRKDVFFMR